MAAVGGIDEVERALGNDGGRADGAAVLEENERAAGGGLASGETQTDGEGEGAHDSRIAAIL